MGQYSYFAATQKKRKLKAKTSSETTNIFLILKYIKLNLS